MKKTTITAHAGCLNTQKDSIESILTAIEIGADYSEVDVNCLRDGTAVLKHDAITDEDNNLVDLEKVFNVIKHQDIKLNLDIKNKAALPYIEEKAIEIDIIDKLVLSGVDEHDTLKLKNDGYKVSYLMNVEIEEVVSSKEMVNKYINHALESNAVGLNIHYNYCTKELIEEAHKNNLKVSAWTIDDKLNIKRFLDMNVDNITTNRPDLIN